MHVLHTRADATQLVPAGCGTTKVEALESAKMMVLFFSLSPDSTLKLTSWEESEHLWNAHESGFIGLILNVQELLCSSE